MEDKTKNDKTVNVFTNSKNSAQELTDVKKFTQDEVNNIVEERLARERRRLKKEMSITEELELQEKNAEQKILQKADKKLKEIMKREEAVTKRELKVEAKEVLINKGLPISLSEILDYTNPQKCKESLENISKVFQEAIKKAVEEKLTMPHK